MLKAFGLFGTLALMGTLALAGCGSQEAKEESGGPPKRVNLPKEWWDNPGEVDTHMAAIGTAPCPNPESEGTARTLAEADGRAKIAASVQARITSLVENWGKIVGDTADQRSFTSLLNDEAFIRQFVDRSVVGARPIAYKYVPERRTLYALLIVQDPQGWMIDFAERSLDKAAGTLLWTQAQKEDFRKKMDEIQKRYAEEDRGFWERVLGRQPPASQPAPGAESR